MTKRQNGWPRKWVRGGRFSLRTASRPAVAPQRLLYNRYSPKSDMKLTAHLYLLMILEYVDMYLHLPLISICCRYWNTWICTSIDHLPPYVADIGIRGCIPSLTTHLSLLPISEYMDMYLHWPLISICCRYWNTWLCTSIDHVSPSVVDIEIRGYICLHWPLISICCRYHNT
jgi:hypothetical protein